ncbi:MAG TPA: hypothetical protein VM848_06010 [Acidimicrobiia bacterium]|nr:hypothetical protein [Acidimicrobiia bacterium]
MAGWLGRKSGKRKDDTLHLTATEVLEILDERSRKYLGVAADKAIRMAENGELPDDLSGSIVGSWVIMAKGAKAEKV